MRRTLLVACLVFGGSSHSANAAPKEILRPNGVPPEFALLRSSGGKFILSRVVTKSIFETQRAVDNEGRTKPAQAARIVSENRTEELPVDQFDVYTLSGQKYPKSSLPMLVKWLAERKKPWRVLVSKDGKPVDPYYRQFASEGTLILVRKTKTRSGPARAKLPGSAEKPATNGKSARGMKMSKLPSRSVKNGKRIDLLLCNRAKQAARIFWVDYEGREKDFGTIQAGESIVQQCGDRSVWRFKILGETVSTCCVDAAIEQAFNIRPPKYALTKFEAEVLRLINVIRKNNGLQTLRHNRKLSAASRDHSKYMSRTDDFSHQSTVAGKYSFTDRAQVFGTSAISENIAWDGGGPKSVVNMWMNSPGHQANILDPSATTIGIGHAGVYWTQMFGSQARAN